MLPSHTSQNYPAHGRGRAEVLDAVCGRLASFVKQKGRFNLETKLLDATAWKIIQALQENARLSYADLAKMVNLTPPAVAERVRKLEEAGVLMGYHAAVNTELLGAAMTVIIHMRMPVDREKAFRAFVQETAEILECYNVTGEISYIVRAAVASTSHLEDLLVRLTRFGQSSTQLVLSVPVAQRTVGHSFQEWRG